MAKKNNNGYVDLKTKPVPEGRHLLEVDNLKMYLARRSAWWASPVPASR